MANNTEKTTICSTSPRAMASITLVGKMCRIVSTSVGAFVCTAAPSAPTPPDRCYAFARAHQIDQQEADREGEGGDDLEVQQCLRPHAADTLEVARAGDPLHHTGKHQRCDHQFDEVEENIAGQRQPFEPAILLRPEIAGGLRPTCAAKWLLSHQPRRTPSTSPSRICWSRESRQPGRGETVAAGDEAMRCSGVGQCKAQAQVGECNLPTGWKDFIQLKA